MKIQRKSISLILSVLLICMVFYAADTAVYANSGLNLSKDGSISITMHSGDKVVPGGSLVCYKAADLTEQNGIYRFRLSADFSGSRVSLDNISSADTAAKLAQWAKKENLSGMVQEIDANGYVKFSGLKPGLYLLVQEKAAEGYYKAAPFLVSVPMNVNGVYVYDVEASPKVELTKKPGSNTPDDPPDTPDPPDKPNPPDKPDPPDKPNPPDTPDPPDTPNPPDNPDPDDPVNPTNPTEPEVPILPQTGQLNWPVPVMCISGLVLISTGILIRNRRTENEE